VSAALLLALMPTVAPAGTLAPDAAPAIEPAATTLALADTDVTTQTQAPPQTGPAPDAQPAADDSADGGMIVVTARPAPPPGDPMQQVNVQSFAVVQSVDKALVGPIALTYKRALPGPVRSGLRNVLRTLDQPVAFVNFLLQLKPGKAVETLGRFTVNATLGIGGLVDVAKDKPFNLPHRRNGFANTLGYYGVKPGPYLFLPIIGPTTVRDLFGRGLDMLVLPVGIGYPFNDPFVSLSKGTLSALDERAETDEHIRRIREESPDPYATFREEYLKARQAEIDALRGIRPEPAPSASPAPAEPVAVAPAVPATGTPATTAAAAQLATRAASAPVTGADAATPPVAKAVPALSPPAKAKSWKTKSWKKKGWHCRKAGKGAKRLCRRYHCHAVSTPGKARCHRHVRACRVIGGKIRCRAIPVRTGPR